VKEMEGIMATGLLNRWIKWTFTMGVPKIISGEQNKQKGSKSLEKYMTGKKTSVC